MKQKTKLEDIFGGAVPNIILYPAIGCGTNMAYTYYKNPDSNRKDMGRACLKGALHGLNPAMNLLGPIGHAPTRYALGMGYGFLATEVSDYAIQHKSPQACHQICSPLLGNDS